MTASRGLLLVSVLVAAELGRRSVLRALADVEDQVQVHLGLLWDRCEIS